MWGPDDLFFLAKPVWLWLSFTCNWKGPQWEHSEMREFLLNRSERAATNPHSVKPTVPGWLSIMTPLLKQLENKWLPRRLTQPLCCEYWARTFWQNLQNKGETVCWPCQPAPALSSQAWEQSQRQRIFLKSQNLANTKPCPRGHQLFNCHLIMCSDFSSFSRQKFSFSRKSLDFLNIGNYFFSFQYNYQIKHIGEANPIY